MPTRRHLLKTAALASWGIPYFLTAGQVHGQSKNDRLRMGLIGAGGQGRHDAGRAAPFADAVAVADVDRRHADEFASKFAGKCKAYDDYRKLLDRKDIDIVIVGTPDHWHTRISLDALAAGKDVYCEKPLTLTIDEGKRLAKAVKQSGRVFQVGTQQRSENKAMFLKAVALARSGRLGKKLEAHALIGGAKPGGPFATSQPPKELNWERWLGQAPLVHYTPERCHRTFRWWLEYSGGKLTDWGAHHIDIAQWAIGCENTGPVEVFGKANWPQGREATLAMITGLGTDLPNGYNTATEFQATLVFANGSKIVVRDRPADPKLPDNGILLVGEQGRIFVSRKVLQGEPIEAMTESEKTRLDEDVLKLCKGKQPGHHMRNFVECVRDRSQPISDVCTHHRSMTSCHLSNIAMLLNRRLQWDPEQEDFTGDDQASAMRSRTQRAPYAT